MTMMTKYDLDRFKDDIKRLYNFNLIDEAYYLIVIDLVTQLINKGSTIFTLLETIDLDKLELDQADK